MRSSSEALERNIADMRALAVAIEPANQILASSSEAAVIRYVSVRRRFDYSAMMISLYASFEGFIEDIVSSYSATMARYALYSLLPDRLTKKHLSRSGEMLARSSIDQVRYPGLTSPKIVENLFHCLSGKRGYQLNDSAITAHDRNLRYSELSKLLLDVDISAIALGKTQPLIDWYCKEMNISTPIDNVPLSTIELRLDEFVERRNDVAHRGGNPASLLGASEMMSLVSFVHALSQAVYILFVSMYLRIYKVSSGRCFELLLAAGPYQQKRVWVINPPSVRLRVGQPVFALSDQFQARWGRVQSLQVNGVSRNVVKKDFGTQLGIGLNFPAPKTARLYVLKTEDELVWSNP